VIGGIYEVLHWDGLSCQNIRGLTIKFANSPECACRGSSWQKPQYGLMALAYAFHSCVVVNLWQSLLSDVYYCLSMFWHLVSQQCTCLQSTVREFLASKRITMPEHPPYSPDLAPNYFFLFPKIQVILKGRHFDDIDNIRSNTTTASMANPQNKFQNCSQGWSRSWHRCIASQGECSEGDHSDIQQWGCSTVTS
jgi:hypothetical protein